MKILSVCLNPTFQVTMRFSSFAMGEVNRASEQYLDASGKGMNCARIASQLGEQSILLTHLGGPRLQEMIDLCNKDKVEVLWADSHSDMRTCTTILSDEYTTELVQEPVAVKPGTEEPLRELFHTSIGNCDALVILGTRAPGYSQELYADFVKEAKRQNKFVLLDIKGEDLKQCLVHKPDVVKINLSEAVQTFLDVKLGEQEDAEKLKATMHQMLEGLHKQYGTTFVLSHGSKDIWVQDETFFTIDVQPIKAVNTIGCGDALSAALTIELLKGAKLQQAIKAATKVATKNAKTIHPGSIV